MAMTGGTGKVGFLVKNMQLNRLYGVKDIEKLFADNIDNPEQIWGELTREETKRILTSVCRAECYSITKFNEPRRILLSEPFEDNSKKHTPTISEKFKELLYSPLVKRGFSLGVGR